MYVDLHYIFNSQILLVLNFIPLNNINIYSHYNVFFFICLLVAKFFGNISQDLLHYFDTRTHHQNITIQNN